MRYTNMNREEKSGWYFTAQIYVEMPGFQSLVHLLPDMMANPSWSLAIRIRCSRGRHFPSLAHARPLYCNEWRFLGAGDGFKRR